VNWRSVGDVRAATTTRSNGRRFVAAADVDVVELDELTSAVTAIGEFPHAAAVVDEVVVYEAAALTAAAGDRRGRGDILGELAAVLGDGPGVFLVKGAVDRATLERTTLAFERMIAEQRSAGAAAGDHFAAAGVNDRVWNALEKLAVDDPEAFVDYYECEVIELAALAWLGPGYQVTSQVNVVNPGGAAQQPHRDYHLGFLSDEQGEQFPAHVHALSPALTLQGAVAHCAMPVESGPTMLLPHSHKLVDGYVAWRRPDVIDLFERKHVQPSLEAGDAVFLNPAVLHGAGTNRTADVRRMANLLQISSAFGRAMESVDRTRTVKAVFSTLLDRERAGWDAERLGRVIAASAEGYAFPTNLDRDPPIGGLAPPSQADLVRQAVSARWSPERLAAELDASDERRRSHGP
jgi:ectoine hydroxylase-related dioxygenase (phytanoyl-CoA dioxygenase family)